LHPKDYQRVFKQGRKHRGPSFTFICRANEFTHARLGLAIAKRHIPTAVGRNRVRRMIREGFRLHQAILGNVDIVVIVQRNLPDIVRNQRWIEDLTQQWQLLTSSKTS